MQIEPANRRQGGKGRSRLVTHSVHRQCFHHRDQIAALYYDMAISCYPANLSALQISHDPQQLMMGFDQPCIPPAVIGVAKESIAAFAGFGKAEQSRIDAGTASAILPRLAAAIKG